MKSKTLQKNNFWFNGNYCVPFVESCKLSCEGWIVRWFLIWEQAEGCWFFTNLWHFRKYFFQAKADNRTVSLGTHSIRKGAVTYASNRGISWELVNIQGRWKGERETLDTCIQKTLPYPDAKVASILCGSCGAWKYAPKTGRVISDRMVKAIAPNIYATFGENIAHVLAPPLLWVAYEGDISI